MIGFRVFTEKLEIAAAAYVNQWWEDAFGQGGSLHESASLCKGLASMASTAIAGVALAFSPLRFSPLRAILCHAVRQSCCQF